MIGRECEGKGTVYVVVDRTNERKIGDMRKGKKVREERRGQMDSWDNFVKGQINVCGYCGLNGLSSI